jgi:hypothetical protein
MAGWSASRACGESPDPRVAGDQPLVTALLRQITTRERCAMRTGALHAPRWRAGLPAAL